MARTPRFTRPQRHTVDCPLECPAMRSRIMSGHAPIFQPAENMVSNTIQCGFESHSGHLGTNDRNFPSKLRWSSQLFVNTFGKCCFVSGPCDTVTMYSSEVRWQVLPLLDKGVNSYEICRLTGVDLSTLRLCCAYEPTLPESAADYAYLLGLYLGDGWLTRGRRDVYALCIACCNGWPGLLRQRRTLCVL